MASELKILAIDTATEACSVVLNIGGEVARRFEVAPNGHSRLVLGMVESLLLEAGLELRDLDVLAVDVGPGSFTGVRIGIGVAQGLGYGAGREIVAVGSLEALAYGAVDGVMDGGADGNGAVLAAIDARMGQVYYGLYGGRDGGLHAIVEPVLAVPELLVVGDGGGKVGDVIGVGSGWDRYGAVMREALNGSVSKWLAERYPDAASVSRIAAMRGVSGAVSPMEVRAAYVRDVVAQKVRP